jgi:hypothetical protein
MWHAFFTRNAWLPCWAMPDEALATTFTPITSEQLRAASEVVIVGRVTKVVSKRARTPYFPDECGIVSDSTIVVEEYLYNPTGLDAKAFTIREMGGTVGKISTEIISIPVSREGQHVAIHLRRQDGRWVEAFAGRGKYDVLPDGSLGHGEQKMLLELIFGPDMTLEKLRERYRL